MLLYENAKIKNTLIEEAKRICSGEITDELLIRLYAKFSNEKTLKDNPHYTNENFAEEFPRILKLGNKSLTKKTISKEYKEVMKKFLSLCPDPFSFLKFGLAGIIKDFTLAQNTLTDMGFSLLQTVPSAVLVLPLVVLTSKTNSNSDLEIDPFNTVKRELQKTIDTTNITKERYLLFFYSMQGYVLNPYTKTIKEPAQRVTAKKQAYDAIKIMKNDLKLSYTNQIKLCDIFYYSHNNKTPRTLLNSLKANDYQFIQDKATLDKIFFRLCLSLKSTSAQMVLEGIYQLKKNESYSLLENKTPSTVNKNRKRSTETECSIAYDMFTGTISQQDSILVMFPSPYFIRKWTEDNLLKPFHATFVVPTIEEKALWTHIFQVKKEDGKNYTIHTADSLIAAHKKNKISFNKILAFMLDYEKTPLKYPSQETNPHNLCLFISKYCKEADVYCLSSNGAFITPKSFSHTFLEQNLCINEIIFLPNCLESIGPKKKNFWIGKVSTSTKLESTLGYYSHREKNFLLVQETPKYTFNLNQFMETKKRSLLAYAKNPTKKEQTRNNISACLYEFSPEITFRYTASSDARYPKKLRVTASYDVNIKQTDDRTIKAKTTKTILLQKEDIKDWIENTYPYSSITKGKKEEETRNVRDVLSEYLKRIYLREPVSLKTLLYMHPEYEKEFSEEQLNAIYAITKSEIGVELINVISIDSIEKKDIEIDTNLLEVSFEKLFELASQDHNLKINSLYGSEQTKAEATINRRLAGVRSALATKTFTREQAKEFYRILKSRIAQDDASCLGLFIKFFTGLETAAISVLKKEDWKKIEDYGGHHLQIYKVLRKTTPEAQEEPWELFHSPTKFRFIPCSDELDETIADWTSRKKIRAQDYLLSGNDEIVTPKMMNKSYREIMKEMNLEKIAGQNIDEISISLSDYGGDFLRENFRFTASSVAGMNVDEIAYILGNTPQTTFGIYYCDYQNSSSQHLLRTKLNRIGYILKKSSSFHPPKTIHLEANVAKEMSNDESALPIQVNMIVSNKKDEPCNISFESDYGIKIYKTEEPL